MVLDGFLQVFAVGFLGSIGGEVFRWYNLRKLPPHKFPIYFKSWFYWIASFSMAVLGGMLAVFYKTNGMNAILAFHIGLSAPLIVQRLTSNIPK